MISANGFITKFYFKFKMAEKCSVCKNEIDVEYKPMDEWKIKGSLCSKCYSQKLEEHYPGEHIRTNRLTGE